MTKGSKRQGNGDLMFVLIAGLEITNGVTVYHLLVFFEPIHAAIAFVVTETMTELRSLFICSSCESPIQSYYTVLKESFDSAVSAPNCSGRSTNRSAAQASIAFCCAAVIGFGARVASSGVTPYNCWLMRRLMIHSYQNSTPQNHVALWHISRKEWPQLQHWIQCPEFVLTYLPT